jgi:small subunit ribosomal protein S11
MASQKKKKDIKISFAKLFVHTSPNNTVITLSDEQGNTIYTRWAGTIGYKGAKENTPYAAESLAKAILKDAKNLWLNEVGIIFKGTGLARDGVFKAINEVWLIDIAYIKENTPIQFGWCKGIRPKRA